MDRFNKLAEDLRIQRVRSRRETVRRMAFKALEDKAYRANLYRAARSTDLPTLKNRLRANIKARMTGETRFSPARYQTVAAAFYCALILQNELNAMRPFMVRTMEAAE